MKTWRFTRIISMILVLSVLIQMMPMQIFAASIGSSTTVVDIGQQVVTILGEVESLREEDTKHFRLSNGSFIAVSYGMPVHYEGEDGSWEDIDNTITLNSNTSTYQLNRTDAEVSFANALTNGTVLTTSVGDKSITMSLLDTSQAVQMIAGEDEAEVMDAGEEVDGSATSPGETVPEVTGEETVSVETDIVEEYAVAETEAAAVETTTPVVEETIGDEPEHLPEETAGETTDTIAEESVPVTVPEETEASTTPEETVPETAEAETGSMGEMDADAEVTPVASEGLAFDRSASAEIAAAMPTMLTLQDSYSWDVEDIIPEKLQSSLLYEDVFPDIDLLYTAFGHNIKEQIIVYKAQDVYRYDFLLNLDGLTAMLNENGSVSFVDAEKNLIYSIPVPYMEDEAGVISDDVMFVLNQTAQGLVLTVEADADWINADDREFPVKIDPSFVISSGSALDEIYSVYTMQAAPNDTTLGRQYLYVGAQPYSTSNDGVYRTFMHFNNMPDIPAGYEVIGAQLQMYQQTYTQRYCTSFPIGVYEVTTSLPSQYSSYYNWFAAMTWRNNMPAYDESNAIDYTIVNSTKGYRYWNITELVKKWYAEGTDNTTCALVMMNEADIDTYYYYASVAFLAYASSIPPVLIVSYRNNTGIEPYYTYATLGSGAAGTAYIADATGQLKVGKEITGFASTTNPFSLNLVYNSDYFALTPDTDYQLPSQLGLNMNAGSGWTINYIQKVEAETIDYINYLKYTDGDGTIHYFMEDSTPDDSNYPYYDEDGLGLKMKINSTNNYTMADDNGNIWTFTNNYLTSAKDADGNEIKVNYTNGQIISITQKNNGCSEIDLAVFLYSGNYLSQIVDYTNNTYKFNYTDSNLTSIQRNNDTIATYTYDGYRLTQMTDSESAYSISFTYADGKIASYKELVGTTPGATVAVSYPSHSQTTYRDYGADRTANTTDDILTHYLFDNAGRTANAYTTDNAGNVLGATNAAYYDGEETIDKRNNRTIRSASIGIAGQQLLRNTSLENTSDAWTLSDTNLSTAKPRTGAYSIKGELSSNGTQSAQKSSESLAEGTTYTFSAYVNTSSITGFEGDGIYLRVTDGTNTWTSNPVNYTTASDVDGGWARISVTFEAETSGTHTVGVYNSGAIGTFYADDFQLEKGEAPSSHNLIENGSMEMSDYGWTMGTGAAYSSTEAAADSTKSLLIAGDPESQATNASQEVVLNMPGSQTYVLSGWVHANAVPADDVENSKECGLRAIITYSDDTTETHYAPFNSDVSNAWQFVSTTIVPEESTKTVSEIQVVCAYEGNANLAYFDNISLVREVAQTMTYDEDGNLISVTSTGLSADENTYENGNLIKVVTGGYGTYEYTYDTTYEHRLTSVTNGLITQSMGYDGTGNVTSTTLSGSGSQTISTSATYDTTGNRLTSITDATGASVNYAYADDASAMMGLPTSVVAPNGTITTTVYDENGRAVQTGIANTATLQYTYSSGNLSSVQRTDSDNDAQTYGFTYDSFGNMLSASVGSRTLAEYTYNSGNGLLASQSYGNGDFVSFTYDNLGRTKTVTYDDGRVLTYTYNGEGNLHSIAETDGSTSIVYLYTYDSIGRLISSQKLENSSCILRISQTYDENNQLVGQSWQMGSTSYSNTYTYNSEDGSLNTMTTGVGDTLTMHYDGLRRLSSVTGSPFTRGYVYRNISDTQTTTQVSSVSYSELNQNYQYTYDVQGNIATYTAPGKATVTYTYDAQGQLLSAAGSTTYTYTYDSVGNILTASNGTTTHTYTYGDANWKDLLTAFDGKAITYDAIGNPLSDGTWTYTWQNGRQLASMSDGTTAISFAYDTSGQRTSKTVGSVTHDYLYSGGQLLRETYDDKILDFFYDANGIPYALKYTVGTEFPETTVYYYITNLQGDVMQLVDANGTAVASYDYDPYGKVISATGTMAEINPIRYRGYVYDTESGLYYLQSRYYNPEMGRFLNADAFASTGQGIIGNNMFAYCGNNPVCNCDPAGNYYTPAEIHNFVVEDICKNNANKTGDETYISYYEPIFRGRKWYTYGFCDVYDTETHEVWEVKRLTGGATCSPVAAGEQLANYVVRGYLKHHDAWKLKFGGTETTIQANAFTKLDRDGRGQYIIGYFDAGNGLVFYDYYYIPSPDEAVAVGCALVGLYLFFSGAGFYALAPLTGLAAA